MSLLPDNINNLSDCNDPRVEGIVPENKELDKNKLLNDDDSPSLLGMVPLIELFPITKDFKLRKLPIDEGNVPTCPKS